MKTMGFIGCGNMGGAIIRSVAPAKKWHVLVHDVLEETARALASETGAEYAPLDELLKASDIVVLAVKPQILPDLYATLRKHTGKQWISMAAGISLETLATQLHTENVEQVYSLAKDLLHSRWRPLQPVRLLGVGLYNVSSASTAPEQQELFDNPFKRKRDLEKTILTLRTKGRAMQKASLLDTHEPGQQ